MKKILVAGALALIASMSNAAVVSWGNGSTSKILGLDGATAMTAANATAWGLSVTLMTMDGTAVGNPVTAINSMTAGLLTGSNLNWSYKFGEDATTGDEFYIHAVMKVDGKDYAMDIGKDSPFTIKATNNTGTDTFSWAAGTYGGAKWVEVPNEPEPTSALLMLCGLAGLALRRKRA